MKINKCGIVLVTLLISSCANASEDKTNGGYTITWKSDFGVVLETDTNVEYGTIPSYDGPTPTKPATNHYTYVFAGWEPTVTPVTGDATYTAIFTATTRTYTITWINYDGTVLETDRDVEYGTMPSYDGPTPTKASTAQYSYAFSGWSPTVDLVTENTAYTATFSQEIRKYLVVWENDDGTVLETDRDVEYGTTPSYDGPTPTKASTAQYSYAFSGWSPAISPVTGNAIYIARFDEQLNCYTITWKSQDGSETLFSQSQSYGSSPVFDGQEPTKPDVTLYTYRFSGWSLLPNERTGVSIDHLPTVVGDATYYAAFLTFDRRTWENDENYHWHRCLDDGFEQETTEKMPHQFDVEIISEPTYFENGLAEYKCNICQYSYNLVLDRLKPTITWCNWDGSILKIEQVEYNSTPEWTGEKPKREQDETNGTYTFKGWSPTITKATKDQTYTAQYSSSGWYSLNVPDEIICYGRQGTSGTLRYGRFKLTKLNYSVNLASGAVKIGGRYSINADSDVVPPYNQWVVSKTWKITGFAGGSWHTIYCKMEIQVTYLPDTFVYNSNSLGGQATRLSNWKIE